MLNSSSESSAQPFLLEPQTHSAFRDVLQPQDPILVDRLVSQSGVFNPEEIEMARSLVDETLAEPERAGYRFLMADAPGSLEGYTCFGRIPGTDKRYELYWIVTALSARRRGLAKSLLIETESCVRRLGGSHLFAETSMRRDYAPAHALYERMDYTRYCIVPDYHGDGDGLAIFGKKL